jgi:hypothetical protein
MVNYPEEVRWKGQDIDNVDHVKKLDCHSKIFRRKRIIYFETGGHVLTPIFGKTGRKGVGRNGR